MDIRTLGPLRPSRKSHVKIACVLITHLPMKAERKRHPKLRGRPVVIVKNDGSSQTVLDTSPEAIGVEAKLPLQEALSRCKDASLLQADEPYYDAVFDHVVERFTRKSSVVEKAELGCAYIDIAGLRAVYVSEARVADSLLKTVPKILEPRLGIAKSKFPAYAAAVVSSAGQATRAPADVVGFLRPLSLNLLPIPWDQKHRMNRFGLYTLGQLATMPVGAIQAQFGFEGKRAWELASGVDHSQLIAYRQEYTVTESLTFPSPATSIHIIMSAIEILLDKAFARPVLRGKQVRKAAIESNVLSKPPWTKIFAFKGAVGNKQKALSVLNISLETTVLPGALEDMKLTLSGITGDSGVQSNLFPGLRRQEHLRETIRQLEARLRRKPPIYRIRDMEPWSRIPERRWGLVSYDP